MTQPGPFHVGLSVGAKAALAVGLLALSLRLLRLHAFAEWLSAYGLSQAFLPFPAMFHPPGRWSLAALAYAGAGIAGFLWLGRQYPDQVQRLEGTEAFVIGFVAAGLAVGWVVDFLTLAVGLFRHGV